MLGPFGVGNCRLVPQGRSSLIECRSAGPPAGDFSRGWVVRKRLRGTNIRFTEIDPVAFAARLRAARGALGWSQTELGRRAGVTQRAIYRIEIAAVQPRDDTRARIDAAFKLAGVQFEEIRQRCIQAGRAGDGVAEAAGAFLSTAVNCFITARQ